MLTNQKPIELPGMDGVVVFRDTNVEGLFYYMPTQPYLAVRNGTYQYSLVEYEEPLRDNRAGLLSIVVDLHLDNESLTDLKAALERISAADSVSLQPIPWTVGRYSASIEASTPITGVPSLIGTNSALVHFELDLDALNIFHAALDNGREAPISIVYKLSYDSFRPAYQCTVKLNESNYFDWLRKECRSNFIIIDFQSTKTYETLRREKVLEISSINFDPNSDPEFQLSILRSLQYVFQPLPRFGKLPGSNDDDWSIGISCSEMEQIQEISRLADFNMSVAKAVPQAAYVQGVVQGLEKAYRAIPAIRVPSTGDQTFEQDTLVTCYADYELDEITNVVLDVRRKDSNSIEESYPFGPDTDNTHHLKLFYFPGRDTTYEYRYSVYFSSGIPAAKLCSDWLQLDRGQAFVNLVPRDLFSHRMIEISTSKKFPWEAVRRVRVKLTPPSGCDSDVVTKNLDESEPSTIYSMFMNRAEGTDTISYELKVLPKPNFGQWQSMGPFLANTTVYIDPFEKREVIFEASKVDWSSFTSIKIKAELTPDDKPILGQAKTSLKLTKESPTASLTYYYTDSSQLLISYCYSILYSDNTGPKGEGSSTDMVIDIPSPSTSPAG